MVPTFVKVAMLLGSTTRGDTGIAACGARCCTALAKCAVGKMKGRSGHVAREWRALDRATCACVRACVLPRWTSTASACACWSWPPWSTPTASADPSQPYSARSPRSEPPREGGVHAWKLHSQQFMCSGQLPVLVPMTSHLHICWPSAHLTLLTSSLCPNRASHLQAWGGCRAGSCAPSSRSASSLTRRSGRGRWRCSSTPSLTACAPVREGRQRCTGQATKAGASCPAHLVLLCAGTYPCHLHEPKCALKLILTPSLHRPTYPKCMTQPQFAPHYYLMPCRRLSL